MYMRDVIAKYEVDCRIRKLSPRTIDNYTKQLRYFQMYLEQNHDVFHLEEGKKAHSMHTKMSILSTTGFSANKPAL